MDKINFNLDWSYSKIGDKNKIKCEKVLEICFRVWYNNNI